MSDESKRKAYDEFGDASLQSGFDPEKAREYARWQESRARRTSGFGGVEGPIDFDLSDLFQRKRRVVPHAAATSTPRWTSICGKPSRGSS